ncbi:Brp/Blh family beta-carotene 15,15'-dioxygenase [Litoribaculum gwangyangense]|uniref:Probable beta-carotene 15,15'-dioxygenase n=1 Tax=Litoribaculum gwangyangense TaxID=1130722 RepID=A0ABP9CFW4_9FLAO
MDKIYNISIFLSFVGLWITSYLTGTIEVVLGFILIFSFGILHGSNDILLINTLSKSKQKHSYLKVLAIYLLTIFLAVTVFYFIPLFALLLFVAFSAFHFGEQHMENKNLNLHKSILNIFYFVYGLLVLQILFILNTSEVLEIIESIANYSITKGIIEFSFISTLVAFLIISTYVMIFSKTYRALFLKEIFYLVIFTIIFNVSTLIWGFTIYFIFWHSIPSLFEQVSFIYKEFNTKTILKYCIKALPYWIMSLIGISIVFYILKDDKMFYAIFFSFIAAVTFPHALVINKMFLHKKAQSSK